MIDELSLPSLPCRRSPTDLFPPRPSKRARFSSPDIFSSDPPMFSSDDDPAAENYISRDRPKKVFRGPWFNHKQTGEDKGEGRRERTSLRRQFDSAVCIASDEIEDGDAEFSSRVLPLPTPQPMSIMSRIQKSGHQGSMQSEELARTIIEARLDDNDERVDLSQLGLTYLSNATLLPLSTFVKVPSSSQTCDFTNLRPALKIFLARNALKRLPGSLFQLGGLSVLSLRSNKLVEIPSAIRRLKRLEELNLAFNSLHYLPYELLEMLSTSSMLQILTMHPNQFYEPLDDHPGSLPHQSGPLIGLYRPKINLGSLHCVDTAQAREWSPRWEVKYRCRSHVRFFNSQGIMLKGPHFPNDDALFTSQPLSRETSLSLTVSIALHGDVPEPPIVSYSSRAPSLVEIAVRTYSQTADLPALSTWNNGNDIATLSRLLDDARTLRESEYGDRTCTVCGRNYILPRTEWIEWWEIARKRDDMASAASPLRQMENRRDEVEKMIPLVRRGCSWSCVPGMVVQEEP